MGILGGGFLKDLDGNLEAIDILSLEYQLGFTPLFSVVLQTVSSPAGKGRKEESSSVHLYCTEGGKGAKVLADFFP